MNHKRRTMRPAAVALAVVSSLTATAAIAQQLIPDRSKQVQPVPAQYAKVTKGDGQRISQGYAVTRFIVELDDPAAASYKGGIAGFEPTSPVATQAKKLPVGSMPVQNYQAHLLAKQTEVFSALKAQVPELKIRDHLSLVFNGMVVEVPHEVSNPDALLKRLSQTAGVKRVYADEPYYANMVTSNDLIKSPEVWATLGGNAEAGRDIKVAVIDSGIDPDHPMFQDNGHEPVARPTNPDYCTTVPTFCNDKLIVARWYEPFGEVSPDEVRTPQDIDGHGTHVAGTAVGNPVSATYNGVGIDMSGVAPGAHLMVYKALFNDLEGNGTGSSASLMQALEDAVADGADVINNSWGGGAGGLPENSPYRSAFANARRAGVLTVTAAGNDGPGDRTIGCPGCIEDGLTVASSQTGIFLNSRVVAAGVTTTFTPGNGDFDLTSTLSAALDLSSNYTGNTLACSPFANGVFSGEIVLVPRGDCTFAEKATNVQAAGAVGMIVYTNEQPITTMALEGISLPSIMVSRNAGNQIEAAWSSSASAVISAPEYRANATFADIMSGFSSRGPNGDSSFLKPDITAPGTAILSALPGGYGQLSGTSMASPHVAGAAALLLDQRDDWGATDLKSILMTSTDSGLADDDRGTLTSPFDRGAGRLNVADAANTFVVVDNPSVANNTCALGCNFSRTFTNKGSSEVSFNVALAFADPSVTATLDKQILTLAPGASKTLTAELDTRFGVSGWQFGELLLTTSASSHPDMRLPVAVLAETSDDDSIVTVGETTAQPSADGDSFGLEVLGALGTTGEPVTIRVDVPTDVTLDQDSVVFNKTLSQSTQESVSADGRTITWQGTQTDAANTTSITAATGQFFAGKKLDDVLTGEPSRLCADSACDDSQFSVDIADEGGIYLDGVRYDNLVVTTNGIVGAGSNTSDYAGSALNQGIPSDAPPNAFWAPFWTDLEVGPGVGDGRINYVWVNEGDTTWFVWELENAREYGDSTNTPYSFSIWFKLGTDEVYYNYIDLPTAAPERLTIGAESGAGDRGVIGVQHYYDGSGSYPSDGDVLTPTVEAGEKANVKVNFDLTTNLGDVPELSAEVESGEPVTISAADAFADLGREWLTYAEVSSGTETYDAFLAQKVEVDGPVTLEIVAPAANGTVELLGNNELRYTSNNGFSGYETFSYRGVDAAGQVTATANVRINVSAGNSNRAPSVTVSPSTAEAEAGTTVTLQATGSDPDGDSLSYSWVQTGGTDVELSNSTSSAAFFTAPELASDTVLSFTVTVDDGLEQASADVSVTVLATDPVVTNTPPEATVVEIASAQAFGAEVQLDASGSSDADGDTLTYTWQQTAGTSVSLTNANSAVASFSVPEVNSDETLSFEVTVSDGEASDTATLAVAILAVEPENQAPEAVVAAVDGLQSIGTTVYLDARDSSDPDGDTLTFNWTQVSGPTVSIDNANQARASIVVPELEVSESATFQVVVTDTDGLTDTAQVAVEFRGANSAPNASANSALRRVPSGQAVTLSASTSGDPDGDTLAYLWEQVAGPSVELSSPEGETTQFNAPTVTTEQDLTFRLTVSDGFLEDTDEVTISVYPRETSGGDEGEDSEGSFGIWLGLLALPLIWLRRTKRNML